MSRSALLPLVIATLLFFSCSAETDEALISRSKRVFGTMPQPKADPPALVKLGQHLYFSNELSVTRTQSCNTCHPVDGRRAGVDNLPTSPGAHGKLGSRNSPTVLNSDLHFAQFWDGRAQTLEEQAAGPLMNPVEMAMPDEKAVVERLRTSPAIDRQLFHAAFPGDRNPLTLDHAARAIAAFERTLRTRDRFEAYMNGDRSALTRAEKHGLQRFMALGCTSCHNGPAIGGRMFQRMGIVRPYDTVDRGRYDVTKNPYDDYLFKVPSLRNVALTRPYFHDGRVPTLPEAVDKMAWHQLGRTLEPKDRDAIVAFLRALTDETRAQ